ncbi:MAG TPA: potassium channel family protein [Candidatus Thermoplasmatota archaeon]|nr:potassium channel family protein [Candidatus Thermoplasmatota archaeon]
MAAATVEAPGEREARREVLFAVLALGSILIGFSRLADPASPAPRWVQVVDVGIALAFAADWARRVAASDRRGRYALRHAYEVVTFIPFTVLTIPETAGGGLLRGARLLRLLRFARYGAFAKLGLGVARLPRRLRYAHRVVRHAQLLTLLVAGLLTVVVGGVALLLFERGANPAVPGYGEALWWSFSLFTTLAYSVPPPQTAGGYAVTGFLMVGGMAFFGLFTASLASALLKTPTEDEVEEP